MRILLDESLPRRLRSIFAGHEIVTVAEVGWSGVENGELLKRAATRFDLEGSPLPPLSAAYTRRIQKLPPP